MLSLAFRVLWRRRPITSSKARRPSVAKWTRQPWRCHWRMKSDWDDGKSSRLARWSRCYLYQFTSPAAVRSEIRLTDRWRPVPYSSLFFFSLLYRSRWTTYSRIRCIRPYVDSKTVTIVTISTAHFKLDYGKSLYYDIPNSEIGLRRLRQIQNSLACAVVKATKFTDIASVVKSRHWLKSVNVLKFFLSCLHFSQCHTACLSVRLDSCKHTRLLVPRQLSPLLLARPPTRWSLYISCRSFWNASTCLWNQLLDSFRQPRPYLSLPDSLLLHDHVTPPVWSRLFDHLSQTDRQTDTGRSNNNDD